MAKSKLLAPAGSFDALKAAVAAGADEIYFGAGEFNARAFAKGFSEEELETAFTLCRLHGVSTNITLNTLVTDREMTGAVSLAKKLFSMGADAFIVQDIGLAGRLRTEIPGIELHASTQCACHNLDGAVLLSKLGFSRVVLARELSEGDIRRISEEGKRLGFETESFIHGALCVCHSGQCLMSSAIGGRSGNRGECAQPCRMEGCISGGKKGYPLSLKDLTLAGRVEDLISCGVASLKIEGRMKSPDYVYRVVSIWRRLLDEGKNATDKDIAGLAEIFSRGGFTDGYFTGEYRKNNKTMYGVRSDADKQKTHAAEVIIPEPGKLPITLSASIALGEVPRLTASFGEHSFEAVGERNVDAARNAPMTRESLEKNLSKLGETPFVLGMLKTDIKGDCFMPASDINALRRAAVSGLIARMTERIRPSALKPSITDETETVPEKRTCTLPERYVFLSSRKLLLALSGNADKYILPLEFFTDKDSASLVERLGAPFGVRLPRVYFEDERDGISKALKTARELGAEFAEVSNIGHIDAVKRAGLDLFGGIGLNICNSVSFSEYAKLGFKALTLSPELNLPQMRDIASVSGVKTAIFAKGRLPLMVLESCIIKAHTTGCRRTEDGECASLVDRIGKSFPILPEKRFASDGYPCRNIILNSVETELEGKKGFENVMADVVLVNG